MTPDDRSISQAVRAAFALNPPRRLGLAVSGGSDSMALLHLIADWAGEGGGPDIRAVTVNHGLRDGAVLEAAGVAEVCTTLNVAHDTLHWNDWDGKGNLQDQARRARLRLIADWARGHGIETVALGHTADDQAETLLMRLARGSGLDGLAAMSGSRLADDIRWVRPLLDQRREALRDMLNRRGVHWFDDPSNEDDVFDRVKMRRALTLLEPLGITTESLAATASRLRSARVALELFTEEKARKLVRIESGDVLLDRAGFLDLPDDVQVRLLAHALRWMNAADYRPRQDALEGLRRAIRDGRAHVLSGCHVLAAGTLRITREHGAVAEVTARPGEVWDGRWRISGPLSSGYEVCALGEAGLIDCPDWRGSGLPRTSLLASPAVRQGGRLLAAPLAGMANGWGAEFARDNDDFFTTLITH